MWGDIFLDEVEEEEEAGEPTPAPSPHLGYQYLRVVDSGRWRDRAYCGRQPELTPLFFLEAEIPTRARTRKDMTAEVKAEFCDKCEVRKDCFRFAKDNRIEHGIWGGIDFTVLRDYKPVIPDDID